MRFTTFCTIVTIVTFTLTAKADEVQGIEGFSQPGRVAQLSAATYGLLKKIHVAEGQFVQQGQIIAGLDSTVHAALIRIAKAGKESAGQLAAAQSELKLKQQRLALIRQLGAEDHASNEELVRAKSEFELAQANVQIAQERQQLRELEHQKLVAQSKTFEIRAPFDGYITQLKKELGEYVSAADPTVCVLAELRVLSVNFLVPRKLLGALKKGQEILVHFSHSDRKVSGTVSSVSPYPNGETSTYTVKVRVENGDGQLSAGERCRLVTEQSAQTEQPAS